MWIHEGSEHYTFHRNFSLRKPQCNVEMNCLIFNFPNTRCLKGSIVRSDSSALLAHVLTSSSSHCSVLAHAVQGPFHFFISACPNLKRAWDKGNQ